MPRLISTRLIHGNTSHTQRAPGSRPRRMNQPASTIEPATQPPRNR